MKGATKNKVGVLTALIGLLTLVLATSACSSQPSWGLANLSDKGKVEAVQCDQIGSASEQLEDAVTDGDSGALATMGVWVNNKLDDGALKDVRERIKKRQDQCNTVTTTVSASASPSNTAKSLPDDGDAGVRDSDGALRTVPLVGRDGEGVAPVDTTNDPRSPATLGVLLKCKQAKSWHDLVVCVGDDQTYKDAVNARKPQTGFDWNDVLRWANESVDARVIQVFNLDISDAEARNRVRELVGSDVDRLPIARHGCAMNTRRLEDNSIGDFTDCRQMVRVSLAPLVYTGDKVTGMLADRGIFVDCFNLWWIPQAIVKNGPPPQPGNPGTPGTGGGNPPGSTVPPTPPTGPPTTTPGCPPGWTGTPPLCKDPASDDPAARGNAPIGGGRNADPGPGVQQPYTPNPTTPYTPPPAPTVQPTQPPVVTQQPQPTGQPTQTVAPSTQPPNNGSVVPTPGGDFG